MSNAADIEGEVPSSEGVEGPDKGDRWQGLRQAAEMAGVSVATVRRWATSGKIPGELVDGRYGPEWHVDTEAMFAANLVRQDPRPGVSAPTSAPPMPDLIADLIAAKEEAAELRARLSFLEEIPKQLEASREREHELTKEVAEAQVEGRANRERIAELERQLEETQRRRRWWRRSKAGER